MENNTFLVCLLVGWSCFMFNRQRGHLETAPQFTVPCEGRSVFIPFPPGIEHRAVAWQSITQPLRHASFKKKQFLSLQRAGS